MNVEDAAKGDSIRIKAGRKMWKDIPYATNNRHKGIPHEPIRTITTQDHCKRVDGDRFRRLTITELKRCMGFPDDYILAPGRTRSVRMLGNAVCPPVMRDILTQALS